MRDCKLLAHHITENRRNEMKRNLFGSIRQLPSGRFQVRYRDKYGITRTARTSTNKPLTFPSRKLAQEYLRDLESDMRRGYIDGDTSRGNEILRDRVELYLTDARLTPGELRPRTRKLYRHIADDFILSPINGFCIGDMPIKSITKADVRKWHYELQKTIKSGTRSLKVREHPARTWARSQGIDVPRKGVISDQIKKSWIEAGAPIVEYSSQIPTGQTKIAQAYRLLRAVMNVAVDADLIPANPCRIRGAGSMKARERKVATPEQVGQLAATVPPRYFAAVIIAAYTSLRSGEQFGLQRKHIDLLHNKIIISHQLIGEENRKPIFGATKTDSSYRDVPIPSELRPIIIDHLDQFTDAHPDSLVFTTSTGSPITPQRRSWWITAKRICGIDELSWHDLRHTGQTAAANRGATIKDLQRRAGQSTERAAMMYLHGSKERDRKIADALNDDVLLSLSVAMQKSDRAS
jgi:integrase